MGNPKILLTIGTKVFLSVTLIGMLSAGTAWNKLTASLRAFHIPDIFIFTLDITLKYIAVLGEICMEILTSLRLRSIGQNKKKAKAFSGILGISFLKSREMADEMYAAMCCPWICRGIQNRKKICLSETGYLLHIFNDSSSGTICLS